MTTAQQFEIGMPDNLTADVRSREWNTLNRLYGGRVR